MAVTIGEFYQSRAFQVGDNGSRELLYTIFGTDDEEAVRTLLLATAPIVYLGYRRKRARGEPLGGGVWKGYVEYEGADATDEFTFDTTGGTQHITQSLGTVARYAAPGKAAPDFQGAIGVSEDRVEGCEIVVPTYGFTEAHRFSFASLAELRAYTRTIKTLTGRFNDAPFRDLDPGECLFLGATGSGADLTDYPITFRFVGSDNVFGACVGGQAPPYADIYGSEGYDAYDDGCYGDSVIMGLDKMGHDYLWVRYADFEDRTAKALVKRPTAAYVERVYKPGDFSRLGIGVD